jgi:hypothetical protein
MLVGRVRRLAGLQGRDMDLQFVQRGGGRAQELPARADGGFLHRHVLPREDRRLEDRRRLLRGRADAEGEADGHERDTDVSGGDHSNVHFVKLRIVNCELNCE